MKNLKITKSKPKATLSVSDSEWLFDLLPFKPDIATFACYEAHRTPIILKNGAEVHSEGWLRFLKLKHSDLGGIDDE